MRIAVAVVLACGCGKVSSDQPDAASPDAAADAAPADAEVCLPWTTRGGHAMGDPCALPQNPSWRIGVAGTTYNTDDGTYSGGAPPESALLAVPGGLSLRVVSVADFAVDNGAVLRVIGKHPLLVVSRSTIVVAGTIDVSSTRAAGVGAGANLTGCQPAGNGQGTHASGGGGGGGFKSSGGAGGRGNVTPPTAGGSGAVAIARPVGIVRGGCPGGRGGQDGIAGAAGAGGGAIQLTARTSITIEGSGRIAAGGMGAAGGPSSNGGGGGGSGGFIGLDAAKVEVEAGSILAANGGGGGSSCEGGGDPGEDGKLADAAARGGQASGCAIGNTPGGSGAFRLGDAAAGGDGAGTGGDNGGGGAGGGVGYLVVWAPPGMFVTGGVQSPTADYITRLETP